MDKQYVLKYWTTPKDAILPHWKKLTIGLSVAVGTVVVGIVSSCILSAQKEPSPSCDSATVSPSYEIPDSCPWQLVMSDLTHRLRLLEMAFKEQVIAREVIAAEVTNQSSSNMVLERKLEEFISSIRQLSVRLDKLNDQMTELSSRLYSDECLGFLVLVFVIVQIILAVRAKINGHQAQGLQGQAGQIQNGSTFNVPRSVSNSSMNGSVSPKQNVSFKQDVCVVTFNKRAWKENLGHSETLLKYVTDDVKLPSKQSYVIDSQDGWKECPKAKLYIALVDCGSCGWGGGDSSADSGGLGGGLGGGGGGSSSDGNDAGDTGFKKSDHQPHDNMDLPMASLQFFKSSGGHIILVLTNEEGSQRMSNHSLYNTSLPLIQSFDLLQELASNGRVLSIWNDFSPFQLNHVKKIGKALLSLKGK